LRAEDGGSLGGEYSSVAVAERGLGLDLPLAGLTAELGHGLDDEEEAIHSRMNAGEAAAVGVHVESAAGVDGAARDEPPALALGAIAEILEEQDRVG
jgi:hypothetical protein